MAGEPIDIGDLQVGDTVRVVNVYGANVTGPVKQIFTDVFNGDKHVVVDWRAIVGTPRDKQPNDTFYLLERPSRKNARGLAEIVTASQHPSMQNVPRGKPMPVGPEHRIAAFLGVPRAKPDAARQGRIEEAAHKVEVTNEAREQEEALAAMKAGRSRRRRKTRRRKTRKSRK